MLLHDAHPPQLVILFNRSDLHWEVMIQVLVPSKKGYLIRKQIRRQIFSILALFFHPLQLMLRCVFSLLA